VPWIYRIFFKFNTGALGVYHGMQPQHLRTYLNECSFRFDRRRSRPAAFRSLLDMGTRTTDHLQDVYQTGASGKSLTSIALSVIDRHRSSQVGKPVSMLPTRTGALSFFGPSAILLPVVLERRSHV
jgi:hypothetical protein